MPAKDALGSSAEKKEAKKAHGSGTKVSGYVDTPVEKKCGTCEYLHNGTLCTQKQVLKDPEVPFAARSKFKKVDAENGCCSFWEPSDSDEQKPGLLTKLIKDEQSAQQAYASGARKFSGQAARTLRHIGSEEKEHERELKSIKQ